jgi:glycosyltransferase involved in cell wall biosynthesis
VPVASSLGFSKRSGHIPVAPADFESLHSAQMKVLFDHHLPFLLAHGGVQIQIERTKAALEGAGVEVECLRWWDDKQRGDVIHFWGRPSADYIRFTHGRGMKVVMGELLTATGSRSRSQLSRQRLLIKLCRRILPKTFLTKLAWDSYRLADACIAMTTWEKYLMSYLFEASPDRVHIVPNGVEEAFFRAPAATRGEWLVCTATITPRKRVVELAEAAVRAQTPLWIIGKPYSESDPYTRRFNELTKQHSKLIRVGGPPIQDRDGLARIYREARGFVLLSAMESRSLAAEEAAVCECPLLLSDLPWARSTFGDNANYCRVAAPERMAEVLKKFYDAAPTLKPPPKPLREPDLAVVLKAVYEKVAGQPK